jgi:hypothetical protein
MGQIKNFYTLRKIYAYFFALTNPNGKSGVNTPEALIKLAEIQLLKLFVTTCFDPLLAHTLNKIRFGGQEKTQVLAFSPGTRIMICRKHTNNWIERQFFICLES